MNLQFGNQVEDPGDLDPNVFYKITKQDGTEFIGQWIGVVNNPNLHEPPLRFLRNGYQGQEEQVRFSQVIIHTCTQPRCEHPFETAPAAGGKSKKRKTKKAVKGKKKSHKKSKKRS